MNKSVFLIVVLAAVMAVAFLLPKPKYDSPDVIPSLNIPYQVGEWQGTDIQTGVRLMDEKYNFLKALFMREYISRATGQTIYLYLLDAGNFHNPKVCLNSTGVTIRDLEGVPLPVVPGSDSSFKAATFHISGRDNQQAMIVYWITIDGQRVGWGEQKLKAFWTSLLGIKKASLMIRLDTPADTALIPAARVGVADFLTVLNGALNEHDRSLLIGK